MAAKVAAILEAAGHKGRVILQQWDFANRNFMERMDAALASGARVIAILTPDYLATDYCAAEWMHALAGDPLNRRGRLIVLRCAECEPRGLLRTIAYWDLVPIRHDDDLLTDIVRAAIMPDAERRRIDPGNPHWREARALLHEAIKPTPSFTGRESQLFKIDGALWSGKDVAAAITQPAAVTGLGGVGKSTLAREYAWRAQDGYAGVWWLNAASDENSATWDGVEQGLVHLGDHYIRGLAQAQERTKAARYTLDFLAHGGFTKPWLLIYDNVDDPRVLDAWRPQANACVLVTSRISNWSHGVSPIELDAWELPEATAFLGKEAARPDLSEADLVQLAEALGRLPLALAHAAAFLRRRKAVRVVDYIDDLDRHMNSLPKDAEYRSPVFATFRAALSQAADEAHGAIALMSLAAFFAADDIPEELFQQAPDLYPPDLSVLSANQPRLAEALGVLDDLSLIEFVPGTRTFSVHRMVQAAARDALDGEREAWAQRAVGAAFAAFPEPAQATWPQCARLVQHVRVLATHVSADAATRELGWLLGASGEYAKERSVLADALSAYQASLAIRERLAKADPGNAGWQRDVALSHGRVAIVQARQGARQDALGGFGKGRAVIAKLEAQLPDNATLPRDLAWFERQIAELERP